MIESRSTAGLWPLDDGRLRREPAGALRPLRALAGSGLDRRPVGGVGERERRPVELSKPSGTAAASSSPPPQPANSSGQRARTTTRARSSGDHHSTGRSPAHARSPRRPSARRWCVVGDAAAGDARAVLRPDALRGRRPCRSGASGSCPSARRGSTAGRPRDDLAARGHAGQERECDAPLVRVGQIEVDLELELLAAARSLALSSSASMYLSAACDVLRVGPAFHAALVPAHALKTQLLRVAVLVPGHRRASARRPARR